MGRLHQFRCDDLDGAAVRILNDDDELERKDDLRGKPKD
jgi:nitrogen fixation-related uncharacterized protein